MGRLVRSGAAGLLLLGLSACNLVVSEEPWFTAAEAVPVPSARDGLWLGVESDCRFDETDPVERWPDCADSTFVRGNEWWSIRWKPVEGQGQRQRIFAGWEPADPNPLGELLVDNGDHLLGQTRNGEDEPDSAQPYVYFGLRPARVDEAGRLLAMELWLVQCGPLPVPAKGGGREQAARSVTDRPFPGLKVEDDDCVADSADSVRKAATLSEGLKPSYRFRWIRDGWR